MNVIGGGNIQGQQEYLEVFEKWETNEEGEIGE